MILPTRVLIKPTMSHVSYLSGYSGSVESGLALPLLAFKDGFRDLDDLADELDNR